MFTLLVEMVKVLVKSLKIIYSSAEVSTDNTIKIFFKCVAMTGFLHVFSVDKRLFKRTST